ncbi:ABC transporter substrate-binding protein [Pelagibacteraceae bacterium]|nr:ABC transporter substrate-binding protein [Pelagibacteraceae bacterium]
MKKLLLSLVSVIVIISTAAAVTYNSDPKIFIGKLVQDAINILSDKDLNQLKKSEAIKKIAIKNVDIKGLGLYTLGDIRKTLNKEDLNNYSEIFEKYFLKSLTSRLTDYSNNKFEVLEADKKSSNTTIVKSKIAETVNQPEIKIDWRVYTKDPLKPLIRDLIVEGLSLARTQKEEFSSILSSNNNDINVLISKLEEFVKN